MNTAKRNELERVFLARLAGTGVFDPNGDQVGKVRIIRKLNKKN
jgi:hypothetical protein